uniref:Uncharacterized protein n=1 Tax=Knipowitschia caucasica TaxID=637954 RepID=A0AAV2L392_KNICA
MVSAGDGTALELCTALGTATTVQQAAVRMLGDSARQTSEGHQDFCLFLFFKGVNWFQFRGSHSSRFSRNSLPLRYHRVLYSTPEHGRWPRAPRFLSPPQPRTCSGLFPGDARSTPPVALEANISSQHRYRLLHPLCSTTASILHFSSD